MNYKVDPGLYALGSPGPESPVLVTANYKMSFDYLRGALPGRDVWILVLDTKGINVWCASGKGTFSTSEIVGRIESSGLGEVVSHRRLILPQLAGPGVAAHKVKELSGFRVVYGPIRSTDLAAFMDHGFRATPEMRCKTFSLWERTVLIPVELVDALKVAVVILPVFFVLSRLLGAGSFWANATDHGLLALYAIVSAILAGSILTPILLPWLPGRAFSVKGLIPGIAAALIIAALGADALTQWPGRVEIGAWMLLVVAAGTYFAMNFTGASTYTSLSGVKKEMRVALPLQIAAGVLGLAMWFGSRLAA
jgi:acetyl-CoA decarbonylase/synthase complex subunit gamma